MGKNVFANGREISAKANGNRSIAAMPDVCLSPPSPPAGPIPIPYPNFSQSSDTSSGSKKVKIGDKEVGGKNSSNYKKSKGDMAATRSFGMGVVTHTLEGKTKHTSWSFDVKIENKNAIRFLDLTTHNHVNMANSACTTLDVAAQAKIAAGEPRTCEELDALNKDARTREAQPGTSNTVVTASRTEADGRSSFLKSMCPHRPLPEYENGYQPPVEAQDQPACGGGRRPGYRQRNHAENKILHPEMDAQGGGTILLNIWHPSPNPPPQGDSAPCYSCRQVICEAEECGIEVWICRSSGRPPESVRPAAAGLCPPEEGKGNYDPAWQGMGFGPWPD